MIVNVLFGVILDIQISGKKSSENNKKDKEIINELDYE